MNDVFHVVENGSPLLQGFSNEIYEISRARSFVHVNENFVIGGRSVRVMKIMVCTKNWLTSNWITPMQKLERDLDGLAARLRGGSSAPAPAPAPAPQRITYTSSPTATYSSSSSSGCSCRNVMGFLFMVWLYSALVVACANTQWYGGNNVEESGLNIHFGLLKYEYTFGSDGFGTGTISGTYVSSSCKNNLGDSICKGMYKTGTATFFMCILSCTAVLLALIKSIWPPSDSESFNPLHAYICAGVYLAVGIIVFAETLPKGVKGLHLGFEDAFNVAIGGCVASVLCAYFAPRKSS